MSVLVNVLCVAAVLPAPEPVVYDVLRVERHEAFAGKLGRRVTERLVLAHQGRELMVTLPSFHDRFGPAKPRFVPGDRIQVQNPSALDGVVSRQQLRKS